MVGGGDLPARPAARSRPVAITGAHTQSHARTRTHSHPLPSGSTIRPPSCTYSPKRRCRCPALERPGECIACERVLVLFPGYFSGHTGLLSQATENPRSGSDPRVFQQVPRESARRPSHWGVGLCWASSSRPGVVRGLSQVVEAFDHWVTGCGGVGEWGGGLHSF